MLDRHIDLILSAAQAVFWRADIDPLRYTYVSPQADALFGLDAQAWLGGVDAWVEAVHPEDRAAALRGLQAAARSGRGCFEFRCLRPDGAVVWVEDSVQAERDEQGSLALVGVMRDVSERRLAEQERVDEAMVHQRMISSAWDAALEGVIIEGLDGSILRANPAACRLLGHDAEELLRLNLVQDLLVPEQRWAAHQNLRTLRETGSHPVLGRTVQRDFLRKDGNLLRAEVVFSRMLDAEPAAVAVFFRDVSERLRLRSTLEGVFLAGHEGMFITDRMARIKQMNPAAERITGYTQAEALGKGMRELMVKPERWDEHRGVLEAYQSAPSDGRVLSLDRVYQRKNGESYPAQAHVVKLMDGSGDSVIFVRDLTEDHAAAKAQREALQLFKAIAESNWDLLAVVGPDATIEQSSDSLLKAFSIAPGAAERTPLVRLASPAERPKLDAALSRALSGKGDAQDLDLRLKLPRGERLYAVRLRQLPEAGEQRVLFSAREVQTEREAQQQLMTYQRLAVFGQLAAGFAHEVRNPLAGIVSAVQLAQRRLASGQGHAEQLEVIERQAARLRQLIEDVLQHARGGRQLPTKLDPCAAMDRAVDLALQQFGPLSGSVTVERDCSPSDWRIQVGEERLIRLLCNLALNALQAVAAKGGRVRACARFEFKQVVLSVADDGPGFAPDALARAFEPFFTTKPTGSGLGLWIAQSLAQEMGGSLSAQAREPHGALFELRLPLAEGD